MSAFPKRETHFFVWGATPETDAFALAEWLGRSFCTGSLRKGGCLLFSHAVAHFARAFARQLAKLAIEAGQGHIAHLVAYFQYRFILGGKHYRCRVCCAQLKEKTRAHLVVIAKIVSRRDR